MRRKRGVVPWRVLNFFTSLGLLDGTIRVSLWKDLIRFHEDPHHPDRRLLDAKVSEEQLDAELCKFLQQYGETYFVKENLTPETQVYKKSYSTIEIAELYAPLRRAFLILSSRHKEQLRLKQKPSRVRNHTCDPVSVSPKESNKFGKTDKQGSSVSFGFDWSVSDSDDTYDPGLDSIEKDRAFYGGFAGEHRLLRNPSNETNPVRGCRRSSRKSKRRQSLVSASNGDDPFEQDESSHEEYLSTLRSPKATTLPSSHSDKAFLQAQVQLDDTAFATTSHNASMAPMIPQDLGDDLLAVGNLSSTNPPTTISSTTQNQLQSITGKLIITGGLSTIPSTMPPPNGPSLPHNEEQFKSHCKVLKLSMTGQPTRRRKTPPVAGIPENPLTVSPNNEAQRKKRTAIDELANFRDSTPRSLYSPISELTEEVNSDGSVPQSSKRAKHSQLTTSKSYAKRTGPLAGTTPRISQIPRAVRNESSDSLPEHNTGNSPGREKEYPAAKPSSSSKSVEKDLDDGSGSIIFTWAATPTLPLPSNGIAPARKTSPFDAGASDCLIRPTVPEKQKDGTAAELSTASAAYTDLNTPVAQREARPTPTDAQLREDFINRNSEQEQQTCNVQPGSGETVITRLSTAPVVPASAPPVKTATASSTPPTTDGQHSEASQQPYSQAQAKRYIDERPNLPVKPELYVKGEDGVWIPWPYGKPRDNSIDSICDQMATRHEASSGDITGISFIFVDANEATTVEVKRGNDQGYEQLTRKIAEVCRAQKRAGVFKIRAEIQVTWEAVNVVFDEGW